MMRGISLCAGAMLVTSSLSWLGVAQTNLPPSAPVSVVSDPASTSSIGDANRTGNKERSAERVPQDRTIRIGTGDLLQITVFGVPDLAEEVRVNDAGSVSVPLIGNVHLAGLTSEEAQQLIATRLRDGGLLRDPQVAVFQKEYASQGVAVMGEVQRPGIYALLGQRQLSDAISAAGGTTGRAGKAISITHPNQPDKPVIVDMDYMDPSKSPVGNVTLLPGDTVVVSRAGVVYVVGSVVHPSGFVMENNEKMTVLQAVAMAGGTMSTASLKSTKILRKTPTGGVQEIPIALNKILAAKAQDYPLQAEDVLFVPNSMGKSAALHGAQAALAIATGLVIYSRP
jgi:polysaccharide export outer membrane protein